MHLHVDDEHDDSGEDNPADGNVLHDDDIIAEVQVVPVLPLRLVEADHLNHQHYYKIQITPDP